jgi:hypothetical protein
MSVQNSLDTLTHLYDELQQLDHKNVLGDLIGPIDKQKKAQLETLVSKIILSKNQEARASSLEPEIHFKKKTVGWKIAQFFRNIFSSPTKKDYDFEANFEQVKREFTKLKDGEFLKDSQNNLEKIAKLEKLAVIVNEMADHVSQKRIHREHESKIAWSINEAMVNLLQNMENRLFDDLRQGKVVITNNPEVVRKRYLGPSEIFTRILPQKRFRS